MPTPNTPGTPGWFAHGNGTSVPYTVLTSDWANAVQAELVNTIEAAGLTLDKTDQTQLLTSLQTLGRIKLSNDLNMYVSPSGNDSNDGLTSGTPYQTLQRAVNVAYRNYDYGGGHNVIINMANGTYTAGASCSGPLPGGRGAAMFFVGNTGSPSSCVINLAAAGTCVGASFGANLSVSGIKFSASIGSSSLGAVPGTGLGASLGGVISINGNCEFGGTQRAHIEVGHLGSVFVNHDYSITGNASEHWIAGNAGLIACAQRTITLTGTPAFSVAFAWAANGLIYAPGSTFTGSATGSRYLLQSGGIISTNGGGSSFLPGNSGGTGAIADGGFYS